MRRIRLAAALTMAVVIVTSGAVATGSERSVVHERPVSHARSVFYGDLHLLTMYSWSAYLEGVRSSPNDAYRFARGESVRYQNRDVSRSTPPLDFLAVTDQAEDLGLFNTLDDPDSSFSKTEIGREVRAHDPDVFGKILEMMLFSRSAPLLGADPRVVKSAGESAWSQTVQAANRNYQPGKFTTFIAYHWTAYSEQRNLHRNVIFLCDDPPYPFTAIDSIKPEDLWTYLEDTRRHGCDALAIPHNSNLSAGAMFDRVDSEGRPMDRGYVMRRLANEPLVEIAGLSQAETHPRLSPEDQFSSFELFGLEKMEKPAGSYVREALGRGMEIAESTDGVNPYAFGFVGSTDYGNGLSDSAEGVYNGRRSAVDSANPTAEPLEGSTSGDLWSMHLSGAGSLTGVWAEENTRESLFAAFRRKETFATSGTRLKFRFFGGWNYDRTLMQRADWVKYAYQHGVPMGGKLPERGHGENEPSFVVWAVKDPAGANLDRVQIVKIALGRGIRTEKIFDVALSDGRRVDPRTGKVPAVGNTVDLHRATYTNTIGAPQLSAIWRDPQFDPQASAVYYVRVLEIPTPRWSAVMAIRRGDPLPSNVPPTIQERGWSSPIWYTRSTRR